MLHKTRGIVLQTISYSETSLIARIYTERFGLQSYMVNGARGKKAKVKANMLQPLLLVDLVVYHKEKNTLQRISEIRNNQPFTSIPYSIVKTTIAIFLNELLCKAIKEEEPNERLFGFLHSSVQILDLEPENCSNFHLVFMVQLGKYLGFYPQGKACAATPYFDLQEGTFIPKEPAHPYFLYPVHAQLLWQLMLVDYSSSMTVPVQKSQRKELLSKLILYYELHLPSLHEINSHKVLEEVMG
jgi:DNA repair protein RecO (recombination protein O)